jgi:16S rRNA C1402 N4-methylase RsmH
VGAYLKKIIMAKEKEIKEVKEVKVLSELNETDIFTIIFEGGEYEVSGNIANILINKGVAELKK